jgi:hypothetical protein
MSFDAELLVDRYVKIRDKIKEINKQHADELQPYEEALEKIEATFMSRFNDLGVSSMKTNAGTAFKSNKRSVTIADWDSYLGYIREHNLWDLLGHHADKKAVETFREEKDDLPPGINWVEVATINVRRS